MSESVILSDLERYFDESLMHYGTPRHSGRYPWGSGENPYQHEPYFRKSVDELRGKGLSPNEIAKYMGMSTTEYRAMITISKAQKRSEDLARIEELKAKGYSNVAIAKELFGNASKESYVRSLMEEGVKERMELSSKTADFLRDQLKDKRYLSVGEGSERELSEILGTNISRERMEVALKMLEMEGYSVIGDLRVEQVTNKGKFTTFKVLAPEGTSKKDIYDNLEELKEIGDYDNGSQATKLGIFPPVSINGNRVMVRYAEDGGLERDGTMELRRGVEDISLGSSSYAQVRVAVDGTHYLKGMALYGEAKDFPDGVDIIFNTNKTLGTPKEKVFKELKADPDNPFGATIKVGGQRHFEDPNGVFVKVDGKFVKDDGSHKDIPHYSQSVVNILNEEGGWGEYSKTLSSQFLSKQPEKLIKQQLKLSFDEKKDEYDTIMSLDNSAVQKKLLASFADDCDSSAVHLKAASLPRQAFQVILPMTTLKDNQIYAPQFRDGEDVVLIRYPHGGTFEIPRLTVVNNNQEGKSKIGANAKDAVGINSKVAEQLSGADFDGDTVLVIPVNDRVHVKTSRPLEALKGFDPKQEYKGYEGMKVISSQKKQTEMGIVSNLITDMTLQGATTDELARAVKHSMVVIDSEKHKLDYQRSYRENGILELQKKYQNGGGASTLISKAKSTERVEERKIFNIDRDTDPATGEKIFRETGRTYVKPTKQITELREKIKADPTNEALKTQYKDILAGSTRLKAMEETTKMAKAKDARELISPAKTAAEVAYADYANKLKALANTARKSYLEIENTKYVPEAAKRYSVEVASLKAKLNTALKNAPRERQAQLVATVVVKAKKQSNPDMDKAELKKASQQALSAARARMGASRRDVQVNITPKEWEAIQAGAVSNSLLRKVLDNADMDAVKQMAMPRGGNEISAVKEARIRNMLAMGYTTAMIAEAVGVSTSTVNKYS